MIIHPHPVAWRGLTGPRTVQYPGLDGAARPPGGPGEEEAPPGSQFKIRDSFLELQQGLLMRDETQIGSRVYAKPPPPRRKFTDFSDEALIPEAAWVPDGIFSGVVKARTRRYLRRVRKMYRGEEYDNEGRLWE